MVFSYELSRVSGSVRRLAGLSAVLASTLLGVMPSHAQAAPQARVALPQVKRTMPAGAADTGEIPVSQPLSSIVVELKRSATQQADLDAFLSSQQRAGSPQYHQWVTTAEFAKRFAPGDDVVGPVKSWLQSQGLQVQTVSAGGMRLVVSGSAQQATAAFAVQLHRMAMPTGDGVQVVGIPSVPASMAKMIRAVSGLENFGAADPDAMTALATAVDTNTAAVVVTDLKDYAATAEQLTSVLEQASAQGQSVIAVHADPSALPARALAILIAGDVAPTDAQTATETTARPDWQAAPGLPENNFRATPDAVTPDANALANTLHAIVTKGGARQGEVAATFYRLAPEDGVFAHADSTLAAGSWAAADGLGTVNLDKLLKVWPFGTTAPGQTQLTVSPHTITHGGTATFTVAVSGSSGTPSGTVTVTSNNGITVGTGTLNNGTATVTTTTLPGGQYSFTATYSGDNTYTTSTSNSDTLAVNAENAVISTAITNSPGVGGTVHVTVTVKSASGVGTPAGTVTVFPYGTAVGSNTYTGTLAATSTAGTASVLVIVPATNAGTFGFQANCTTDANFACPAPASFQVTIGQGRPTVTLATPTAASTAGQYNVVATITPPTNADAATVAPTGTMTFTDNGNTLGTATINGTTATYTGALSSLTQHSLAAAYGGDTNYTTANSANIGFSTSATAPASTVLSVSGFSVNHGSNLTLTLTLTANGNTLPTGTVTFLANGSSIGTAQLSNGVATLTTNKLAGGQQALTATYGGDNNFSTSTSNQINEFVNAEAVTVAGSVPATAVGVGGTIPVTVTVTAPSGVGTPSGTVTVFPFGTSVSSQTYTGTLVAGTTAGTATATVNVPATNAGTFGFQANCTTTTTFSCNTPQTFQVTVAKGTPVVTLAAPSGSGSSVTLTATVAKPTGADANAPAPTGIVQFTDGGTQIGTGTLSNGTATFTGALGAGTTHTLVANYQGDGNYNTANSTASSQNTGTTAPASTVLSANPTTATHGTNVALTLTVTGTNNVVPTGTATFTSSTGGALGTATLVNGVGTLNTKNLPGGAQSITATYGGDTNYTTSSAAAVPVTINPEAVTATGSVPTTGVSVGSLIPITVTVTAPSGVGTPSGTVTVVPSGTSIAGQTFTGTLGAGTTAGTATATVNVPGSNAGTFQFQVSCTTNATFSCAGSQTFSITIAKGTPTVTLSSPVAQATAGQYQLTAQITTPNIGAGLPVPTGTVQFMDGSTVLGTAPYTNGSAVYTGPLGTGTTHSLVANYQGDSNYNTANSNATNSSTGTTAPQSTTIALSTHTVTHGANITLTVTVVGQNNVTPTGTVTLSSAQGGAAGTSTLVASGTGTAVATLTTNKLAGGQYGFFGTYSGDSTYTTSTSNVDTATINPEQPTITATVPNSIAVGSTIPVMVTVTSASGVGTPAGTVTVFPFGTTIGSQTFTGTLAASTTPGTATATVNVPASNTGTFQFQVNCTSDANFACNAPQSFAVTIGKATPTVTLTQSASTTAGSVTLTATVAAPAGSPSTAAVPTGTVQFLDGTTVLGTGTLTNGVATFTGALASGTTHSLTAAYQGDTNYAAATSAAQGSTTNPSLISTTTSLTSSSGYSGPAGTVFTLLSTVSPSTFATSGAAPTGTITIRDSIQGVIGTGTLASGTASINVSNLSVGAHSLTASYSGDSTYAASVSTSSVIITVVTATATDTVTLSPAGSIPYGYNGTLNISVSLPTGTTAPSGTVTATISGNGGTFTAQLQGTTGSPTATATISFPVPPPGTYTITVTCSTSVTCPAQTVQLVTTKGFTTTTLSLTPTTPQAGSPISVSATVANSGTGTGTYTYTGTVSFYAGGRFLGSAQVVNGTASTTVTINNTATQNVTAIYSGDASWNGSTSQPISVTPTPIPATIVLSSNATQGVVGQNIILTATVSSATGGGTITAPATLLPTGTVTFYDSYNGTPLLLGTAPLVSNGFSASVATLTTTGLRAGVHNITAVYAGDSIFMTATSNVLTINIGDFNITFSPSSLFISQGGTGTATVILTSSGGFTGQIALACTPPANTLTTCNVAPSVLNTSGTAILTITTTANTVRGAVQKQQAALRTTQRIAAAAGLGGLLSLCFLWRRRKVVAWLFALLLAVMMVTGGCGTEQVDSTNNSSGGTGTPTGGSNNNGSPLGTVNFTVTAASVDQPVNARHQFLLPVTIQ